MATGRDPSQSELQILTGAQRTAATWCGHVVSRLEPVVRFALGGGDPRLYPAHVLRTLSLFETHFKSRSPGDLRATREDFQMVQGFLQGLGRTSYRIVSNAVVDDDANTENDTYAVVYRGDQTIYVAERFFGVGAPLAHTVSARSEITVGPRILNDAQKARLLIHEAAHARLRILHSGGTSSFDREGCGQGVPNIRTFRQASGNAYCYDLFAFCISREP